MNSKESLLDQLDIINYVDMHIHLEEAAIKEIRDDILYIANSVDRLSYNKTLALSEMKKNVIPLFGIHPVNAQKKSLSLPASQIFARSALIGEIGLDFHWIEDRSTDDVQIEIFSQQLSFCKEYGAIPIIHTKGAEKEILEILKQYAIEKSIIHWYSGPEEYIFDFLKTGSYFTIGPDIFKGSQIYKKIPMKRLFLETDNPTGLPWITGESQRSDDIVKVYDYFAQLINMELSDLQDLVKNNLRNLLS